MSNTKNAASRPHIFAIASSTGGPQALAQIFALLPESFPVPIVVAQHIADGFASGMVQWLNSTSKLTIHLGKEGELPRPGNVYISPSETHLAVAPSRRLLLQNRTARDIYHPSCNVLLESVATVYRKDSVGIILTGMGSDGAQGMAAIKNAGGNTLGQDEASSVVYGMNRVAFEQGAINRVLPLELIAREMMNLAGVS